MGVCMRLDEGGSVPAAVRGERNGDLTVLVDGPFIGLDSRGMITATPWSEAKFEKIRGSMPSHRGALLNTTPRVYGRSTAAAGGASPALMPPGLVGYGCGTGMLGRAGVVLRLVECWDGVMAGGR